MISTHAMPNARSRVPAWIDLIPAGVFSGRDGRGPYRNTNPNKVIAATLAQGLTAGLPIDFDHAIDLGAPQGLPAPAAGWIRNFRIVRGVIQGFVQWTNEGAKAVASKAYRYISPVFEFDPDGNVMFILRAAVTNNPNLNLTAISSRQGVTNRMAISADMRKIAQTWGGGMSVVKLMAATILRTTSFNSGNIAIHAARGAGGRHVIDAMLDKAKASGMDGSGSTDPLPTPDTNTAEELVGEAVSVLQECLGHVDDPENFKKLGMVGAMIHMALDEITPAYTALHPEMIEGHPVDPNYSLSDPEDLAKTARHSLITARGNLHSDAAVRMLGGALMLVQAVIGQSVNADAQISETERAIMAASGKMDRAAYIRARAARAAGKPGIYQ
jgi:hypothetical protein